MDAKPYRILIIEDSPEDRTAYRRRIAQGRAQDFQFWETASGEEGLRLCAEIKPDCVLLDYQLPDLDGLEFLDRVRAIVDGSCISIVMLTGHGNEAVAVQAMKKGVQDYLIKGINSESLNQVVQAAIEKGILRRQVEEQRRELERLSADRLRLVNELQQQTAALSEASQRKDEFLAMLGHELRNPLAPVRNALHILRLQGKDLQTLEHVRQIMDRQIGHMTRIIDDLLDVSRIKGGKITLRPERLDLRQLVSQSVEDHGATFREVPVRLSSYMPDAPVWVTADATRLTQVLDNLLTNALKFTNPGGAVTLLLSASAKDEKAVLVVHDSGIGIEASMLPRLFDAFSQADRSLDRSRGGLGLGLALVKGLVEFHGGTVEAASDGIGRGATFTVRLPLEKGGPVLSERAPAAVITNNKPLHVLVVEDNRDSAESLRMILALLGYKATLAYSGPAGLNAAKAERPDVVICDIGLPAMDGFALAEALRKDPHTAKTRLIAVTGYGGEEDKERAIKVGFNGLLVKPVDLDALLGQLNAPEHEKSRA